MINKKFVILVLFTSAVLFCQENRVDSIHVLLDKNSRNWVKRTDNLIKIKYCNSKNDCSKPGYWTFDILLGNARVINSYAFNNLELFDINKVSKREARLKYSPTVYFIEKIDEYHNKKYKAYARYSE